VLTHTPKYRAHIKVMRYEKQAGVVHHIYWLTAAETGYLGLAVFLIVIARFAWRAGGCGWRSRSLQGILLIALALGFCTLHASGFLEWAARISPVTYLFAITAGISVGFADAIENQDRSRTPRTGWLRRRRPRTTALVTS
jgi:O-antigen ligase